MASELTVTLLRYAFLALIWFFVFLVVSAARRDLGLGKNYRAAPVDAVPEATHIAPPPTRPSQLVITAGAQAGAMMQLGDHPITIGRHARLFPQGSRWFLEDLNSTNGTFVNGERLTRATPIEPGDDFRVGGTTMQLRG